MEFTWIAPGEDIAPALAVRINVFVEEQGFSPDTEPDDIDPIAHHLVVWENQTPVGTGRVFPHIQVAGLYVVGRLAVLQEHRAGGIGAKMMAQIEEKARALGATATTLGAQCQAQGFYEKLGYRSTGKTYMDEHCPHVHMEKML